MTSDLTSVTLITLVSMPILHPTAILVASEAMGDLQMTSEVEADLKIELSDLNYLCSHASLACKGLLEMIHTTNVR